MEAPSSSPLIFRKMRSWQLMLVFQITDPYDPRLSSDDDNPKIINDT